MKRTDEYYQFIILKYKPWLKTLPLKAMKTQNLYKYYVVTEDEKNLNEEEQKIKDEEVQFIIAEVISKKELMREK